MALPLEDQAKEQSKILPKEDPAVLSAARDIAVKAAREAVRDSTRLTRLLTVLNDSGPLEILLDRVLSTLSELFSADIVVLLDPVGLGKFTPLAAIGLSEDLMGVPFLDGEESCTKRVMRTRAPLSIENADTDPHVDAQLREMGAKCLLGLPVDENEVARGVLFLGRLRPRPFSSDETALLSTMAYRIGRTLIEAQRSAQFEMLVGSGRALSRRLDLLEVAADAVQILPSIVHADVAALFLRDLMGELYLAARNGLHDVQDETLCSAVETLANTTRLGTGEPFSVLDLHAMNEGLSLSQAFALPVRTLLAVPIYRKESLMGVLLCARISAVRFSASAEQAAVLYCDQVTAAVENAGLYQAVHTELSERKRIEEQQRKWERQQQQIQKARSLSSMAGAIAHHFNNQLCVVMGSLEVAMHDVPRFSETGSALVDAMSAVRKASDVSRSMLMYIGQTVGVRKPLDLALICQQNLPLLETATPEGLIFRAELPPSGPVIHADGNQIQQVLTHLVTNAWESIDKKHGTVRLGVSVKSPREISAQNRFPIDWDPEDRMYACIEISDTGCGIADSDIDHLFDPFYSSKFTGRGLGLPVSLGIVKAHGGAVALESAQGRGSTFRVFLPVSEEGAERRSKVSSQPRAASGRGVLLVDDEPAVRNVTGVILRRIGYVVHPASDGTEALRIFKERATEIHAAVCDLSMPGISGWETVSGLRRMRPDLPVVIISGHDESDVISDRLSQETPMPVFLHKPFLNTELKEAIRKAKMQV